MPNYVYAYYACYI
ncbi:hypothetical protein VTH06DRAFT_279 [Thermothelomyces fergusii]